MCNINNLIFFLFAKVVWCLPLPRGHPAGNIRKHCGRWLHLWRGVLPQYVWPGQGLHKEALYQRTEVKKASKFFSKNREQNICRFCKKKTAFSLNSVFSTSTPFYPVFSTIYSSLPCILYYLLLSTLYSLLFTPLYPVFSLFTPLYPVISTIYSSLPCILYYLLLSTLYSLLFTPLYPVNAYEKRLSLMICTKWLGLLE